MYFHRNINQIEGLWILLVLCLCSQMQCSVSINADFEGIASYNKSQMLLTDASANNAQHHASIRLKELDHPFGGGHICSGALISPSAVLTTAQCVYNYNENKPYHPSELRVILGSLFRNHQPDQALVFGVTHSYQPETFNALSLKDNVAILMLERDIPETSDCVKPISVNQAEIFGTRQNNDENFEFKMTSWLQTNEGLPLNNLAELNVYQVSDAICLRYFGRILFSSGMLCIDSKVSLNTDYGSPLFAHSKLVGLRSFASVDLSPAIYTNVSHHAKWIHSVIADGSNQNSSIWGILGLMLLTFVVFTRSHLVKDK